MSDEMHVKRNDADKAADIANEKLKQEAEDQHRNPTPQNPVMAQIEIVFLEDGTFHINGPWHNRMLFEWVMMISSRTITQRFDQMTIEQARRNAPRVQPIMVPPGAADKLRTKGV